MKIVTLRLKRIPLLKGTCVSHLINHRKTYVAVYDHSVAVGKFTKEWYGWNFDGFYDAGLQLDEIDKLYEIISGLGSIQ